MLFLYCVWCAKKTQNYIMIDSSKKIFSVTCYAVCSWTMWMSPSCCVCVCCFSFNALLITNHCYNSIQSVCLCVYCLMIAFIDEKAVLIFHMAADISYSPLTLNQQTSFIYKVQWVMLGLRWRFIHIRYSRIKISNFSK